MGTEIEKGVKGNSKDLRGFLKGEDGAVNLDLRMEVGLVFAVGGEEGDSGFVGGDGEAVGVGPVSD